MSLDSQSQLLSNKKQIPTTVNNKENDVGKDKRKSSINPDNRCAICLTLMEDLTMLSDCLHTFCFNCIIEWLKMKPECPLCKRAPLFFKHKFKLQLNESLTWQTPAERFFLTLIFL